MLGVMVPSAVVPIVVGAAIVIAAIMLIYTCAELRKRRSN